MNRRLLAALIHRMYRAPAGEGGDEGAGGGGGGGGGGGAADNFDPAAARTFLSTVIPDADYVKALPDEKLKDFHTTFKANGEKAFVGDDPWRGINKAYATKDGKLDDKVLARLGRYATPGDLINSHLALQNKISAGEMRTTLPPNATEDQVKTWRTENGIPEAHDKYELKLKDGLTIGDEDKPIIDTFLKSAHGANYTPAQASAAVDWYYNEVERVTAARAEADKAAAQKGEDALRAAWGANYRTEMNLVQGLLDGAPVAVKDRFAHGRLADGTPIMSDPATMMWLRQMAGELNPGTALVMDTGGGIEKALDDELTTIKGWMGAPKGSPEHKKYWDDPKTQERYRALLNAKEKAGGKAA